MNTVSIKKTKIKKMPDSPGVYFFLDRNKKPIYIGKATSLRDRTKSYFSKDLIQTRGLLLVKMVEEAKYIDFTKTDSVLEAILLEADLIRKFRPTFNTKEKDDKSFNCVVITKEDFPKVLVIRKKEIDVPALTTPEYKLESVFGPYTNGSELKEALKIIRKIIPYRDNKCVLYSEQIAKHGFAKPCFNRQIGLCPGICTGEISKKDYQKQINQLKLFLSGKIPKLSLSLKKEMDIEAKKKNFENAGKIKKTIYSLNHIHDISLIKSGGVSCSENTLETSFKIESYDIAHLAGDSTVGVMIVLKDGVADKNLYRKFNIKSAIKSDDVGSLREVLTRRLAHREWVYPNLFVIDGGKNQLNLAKNILRENNIDVPVVSVLKDENHKAKEILGDKILAEKYRKDILLSNAEAHRFAIAAHRKKIRRKFLL